MAQIWPEQRSSAGGVRTRSLVKACLENDWRVTFFAYSKENSFSDELRSLGVKIIQIPLEETALQALLLAEQPNITIFDRFMTEEQFGWRIRELFPKCLRIIDTIDLHFLRQQREKGAFDETLPRELASLYRSDLNLLISTFEMEYIQTEFEFPKELLAYVPFFYEKAECGLSYSERSHFMFIGNYRHPPNFEAAQYLAKEIWPGIKSQVPFAELHLYGAYPRKEIVDLQNSSMRIFFRGATPDQYETLKKYRVNLAPILFGAGLKGKITDAWSVGTPCVSTPVGAEGLLPNPSLWGGLIADRGPDFVQAAIRLYEDEVLWQSSSGRGIAILHELFSRERESPRFIQLLEEKWQEKQRRTKENTIATLLWHHAHQSTKYFSRWILEKNKRSP